MSPIDIKPSLGRVIRKRRKSKHLSQEDLARDTGLTRNHILRLELGKNGATVDALYAIGDALDAIGSELLKEAETPESKPVRRPRR